MRRDDCQRMTRWYCCTEMKRYTRSWNSLNQACIHYGTSTFNTFTSIYTHTTIHIITTVNILTGFSPGAIYICTANHNHSTVIYICATVFKSQHASITSWQYLSARQQSRRRATEKPIASLAYNKTKFGIDKSDQMASYAMSLRKGIRRYIELTVEILLAVAVANACILCRKASQKTIKIRSFKEDLNDSLLKLSSNIS